MIDALLALGCLILAPKMFWEIWHKGKKFPTIGQRLGRNLPNPQNRPVIWIHAVSVGEVKAAEPFVKKLRETHPNAFLLITTASVTGQEEAKRSLSMADAFRFLPLDFRRIMRKWMRVLRPKYLFFIEGDLWPNLLRSAREVGAKTALISGKISVKSAKRFLLVRPLAKRFFGLLDYALVQNETYRKRFAPLFPNPSVLQVTGNLKFDATLKPIDRSQWAPLLENLPFPIAIVSTHAPEEEEILSALEGLDATLFLAPRHPERFAEVAALLERKHIPYIRWSQIEQKREGERVIFVDAMGQLPIVYSFSKLAIVGGSFSSRIGGHNILEPCLYGIPVFFGPHMHLQQELSERVLEAHAGLQLPLSNLRAEVNRISSTSGALVQGTQNLVAEIRGALRATWEALF